MSQKTTIVTVRLSTKDAERISAVQALTEADKATLLREFIEDGLRKRVLEAYRDGRVTSQRAAEILGIPLRQFLDLLEKNGLEINWDSRVIRDYMRKRYGE